MESNGLVVRRLIKVDFREFDYFIRMFSIFTKFRKSILRDLKYRMIKER